MASPNEIADKPTLHEIAAMPYPASELAMRQHYDPNWRKYSDGDLKPFKVEVRYSYRETDYFTCEVLAVDEDEAEKMAEDKFDRECPDRFEDDCEIDDFAVKAVSQ